MNIGAAKRTPRLTNGWSTSGRDRHGVDMPTTFGTILFANPEFAAMLGIRSRMSGQCHWETS